MVVVVVAAAAPRRTRRHRLLGCYENVTLPDVSFSDIVAEITPENTQNVSSELHLGEGVSPLELVSSTADRIPADGLHPNDVGPRKRRKTTINNPTSLSPRRTPTTISAPSNSPPQAAWAGGHRTSSHLDELPTGIPGVAERNATAKDASTKDIGGFPPGDDVSLKGIESTAKGALSHEDLPEASQIFEQTESKRGEVSLRAAAAARPDIQSVMTASKRPTRNSLRIAVLERKAALSVGSPRMDTQTLSSQGVPEKTLTPGTPSVLRTPRGYRTPTRCANTTSNIPVRRHESSPLQCSDGRRGVSSSATVASDRSNNTTGSNSNENNSTGRNEISGDKRSSNARTRTDLGAVRALRHHACVGFSSGISTPLSSNRKPSCDVPRFNRRLGSAVSVDTVASASGHQVATGGAPFEVDTTLAKGTASETGSAVLKRYRSTDERIPRSMNSLTPAFRPPCPLVAGVATSVGPLPPVAGSFFEPLSGYEENSPYAPFFKSNQLETARSPAKSPYKSACIVASSNAQCDVKVNRFPGQHEVTSLDKQVVQLAPTPISSLPPSVTPSPLPASIPIMKLREPDDKRRKKARRLKREMRSCSTQVTPMLWQRKRNYGRLEKQDVRTSITGLNCRISSPKYESLCLQVDLDNTEGLSSKNKISNLQQESSTALQQQDQHHSQLSARVMPTNLLKDEEACLERGAKKPDERIFSRAASSQTTVVSGLDECQEAQPTGRPVVDSGGEAESAGIPAGPLLKSAGETYSVASVGIKPPLQQAKYYSEGIQVDLSRSQLCQISSTSPTTSNEAFPKQTGVLDSGEKYPEHHSQLSARVMPTNLLKDEEACLQHGAKKPDERIFSRAASSQTTVVSGLDECREAQPTGRPVVDSGGEAESAGIPAGPLLKSAGETYSVASVGIKPPLQQANYHSEGIQVDLSRSQLRQISSTSPIANNEAFPKRTGILDSGEKYPEVTHSLFEMTDGVRDGNSSVIKQLHSIISTAKRQNMANSQRLSQRMASVQLAADERITSCVKAPQMRSDSEAIGRRDPSLSESLITKSPQKAAYLIENAAEESKSHTARSVRTKTRIQGSERPERKTKRTSRGLTKHTNTCTPTLTKPAQEAATSSGKHNVSGRNERHCSRREAGSPRHHRHGLNSFHNTSMDDVAIARQKLLQKPHIRRQMAIVSETRRRAYLAASLLWDRFYQQFACEPLQAEKAKWTGIKELQSSEMPVALDEEMELEVQHRVADEISKCRNAIALRTKELLLKQSSGFSSVVKL